MGAAQIHRKNARAREELENHLGLHLHFATEKRARDAVGLRDHLTGCTWSAAELTEAACSQLLLLCHQACLSLLSYWHRKFLLSHIQEGDPAPAILHFAFSALGINNSGSWGSFYKEQPCSDCSSPRALTHPFLSFWAYFSPHF